MITIDATVPDARATWYDLWQAAIAVDGMCAMRGMAGIAKFLGELWKREVCEVLSCWKLI